MKRIGAAKPSDRLKKFLREANSKSTPTDSLFSKRGINGESDIARFIEFNTILVADQMLYRYSAA